MIEIKKNENIYTIGGVIFDMDGLMVDTEHLHYGAKAEVCTRYGRGFTEEDNKQFVGMKDIEEARIIVEMYKLPISPEEFAAQKQSAYAELLKTGVTAKPGLVQLLDHLKEEGIIMAIASSSTPSEIATVVETIGVKDYFKAFCSAEEVAHGKPAPDLFLFTADKIGIAPENLIVLEDAPKGIEAATAAGIISFAIPSFETKDALFPESDLFLGKVESLERLSMYL